MSHHSTDVEKDVPVSEKFENSTNYDTGIDDDRIAAFTAKEQKAIFRRVDIRLVITLGCLYCISLLDRTNLGAASVAGYGYFCSYVECLKLTGS